VAGAGVRKRALDLFWEGEASRRPHGAGGPAISLENAGPVTFSVEGGELVCDPSHGSEDAVARAATRAPSIHGRICAGAALGRAQRAFPAQTRSELTPLEVQTLASFCFPFSRRHLQMRRKKTLEFVLLPSR
jgi:hypothetical protein